MKPLNFLSLAIFLNTSFAYAGEYRIPHSQARINFVETGKTDGTPIVFIHAFPMSQQMWRSQVDALKGSARVITFDVRGFGKSGLDAPYTMEFVVDDLIGILDQLKIEKAVVCGLSMGGFVALRAVQRNPERFLGLVLADTKSAADTDKSKLGRYTALKTIREKGLAPFVETFISNSLAPTTIKEQPKVFQDAKKIANANKPAGVAAGLISLTSRLDTTEGLSGIKVPTMILHGEADAVFPTAEATALQQKIPNSTLNIIPRAGHLSNLENPTEFNKHLVAFIQSLSNAKAR